ncbi:MAG: TetR/AcrR family transcriptional regulator [Spirochaetales bacterium]|nr:TetR/AcrR family transcriptional regulator [Spirochaetales bacterium]
MAKRVEGVTEKLLECAREEFLEKGYENASLRTIAQRAGSSKGAIYIRYPDKASLFSALVDEAANGIALLLKKIQEEFTELPGEVQADRVQQMSDEGISIFIDYIYKHFVEFKLLCCSSEPGFYSNFIHRLVNIDVDTTMRFIGNSSNNAVSSGRLTPNFAHLLSESFYTGMFEIVVHDMPREEGDIYIRRLRKFFAAGWMTILNDEESAG